MKNNTQRPLWNGDYLATLRNNAEIAQIDLGQYIGELTGRPLSGKTVSSWERGREPAGYANVWALARIFRVEVGAFFRPQNLRQTTRPRTGRPRNRV